MITMRWRIRSRCIAQGNAADTPPPALRPLPIHLLLLSHLEEEEAKAEVKGEEEGDLKEEGDLNGTALSM
jgi:hypothetical protein